MVANDGMATGVIEALEASHRTAHVVGLNADPEGIEAVKSGKLLATGACQGFVQGCLGVMAAVRHLRGRPVPKEIILPSTVIDKSNYQPYDVPLESRECPSWDSVVKSPS
jgi:ribose transport system substrate-binding protein